MHKNILLVGFGNLGKRHFQGILKLNYLINLYIIDPNLTFDEKKNIKKKYKNIILLKTFSYIVKFKIKFDLSIISTNADIRAKILKKLLSKNKIKNILLEKILFQKIKDYYAIHHLLKAKKIKVWVNCPRRNYDIYKFVKKNINKENNITIDVKGDNWGIGCNSIHFIDLLHYLRKFDSYKIDNNKLYKIIYSSKRKNFYEFKGDFSLITDRGDKLNISDIKRKERKRIISIYSKKKYIIDENKNSLMIIDKSKKILKKFTQSIYQSDLTNIQIDEIFSRKKSSLIDYNSSMKQHLPLISFFLKHYNLITKSKKDSCPIT